MNKTPWKSVDKLALALLIFISALTFMMTILAFQGWSNAKPKDALFMLAMSLLFAGATFGLWRFHDQLGAIEKQSPFLTIRSKSPSQQRRFWQEQIRSEITIALLGPLVLYITARVLSVHTPMPYFFGFMLWLRCVAAIRRARRALRELNS